MQDPNKFAKYLGKLNINVDGEALELDVRLGDVCKLSSLSADNITGDKFEMALNSFLDILKRSYPGVQPEALEKFLVFKMMNFFKEFSIGMGWADEASFKEADEKAKKS